MRAASMHREGLPRISLSTTRWVSAPSTKSLGRIFADCQRLFLCQPARVLLGGFARSMLFVHIGGVAFEGNARAGQHSRAARR